MCRSSISMIVVILVETKIHVHKKTVPFLVVVTPVDRVEQDKIDASLCTLAIG
jgi:hypothetical protein